MEYRKVLICRTINLPVLQGNQQIIKRKRDRLQQRLFAEISPTDNVKDKTVVTFAGSELSQPPIISVESELLDRKSSECQVSRIINGFILPSGFHVGFFIDVGFDSKWFQQRSSPSLII